MSYAEFFDYSMPTLERESGSYISLGGIGPARRYSINRTTLEMGDSMDWGMVDSMLSGIDAKSDQYETALKGIYDKYSGFAEAYNEDMTPILEGMTEDIGRMEEYIGDYAGTLDGMKDTFMNGIRVDPNAAQTRAHYMGNVASAYGAQEEAINRRLASQGHNPYGISGAKRELNLDRAANMAGASNQAYRDWRIQHNKDVQAKQQGMATYANLQSRIPGYQMGVVSARGSVGAGYAGIHNFGLNTEVAKANGYEALLGANENRRTQTLQLASMRAAADAEARQQANQMAESTTGWQLGA